MARKTKISNENETIIKKKTLKAYKEHVGEWFCSTCASGAGQPAATMRSLRQEGYDFEKVSKKQWAKTLYCPCCGQERSHYKMQSSEPTCDKNKRFTITENDRKRVMKLLGNKDAFTGATSLTQLEIDHKIPFTISEKDIKISTLTDMEILENFQLLTPDHNKLKNMRCQFCKETHIRPEFFGSKFYYEGDEHYKGSCVGCGWHDGVKWRDKYNDYTEHQKAVDNAKSNLINYLYQYLNNNDIE